MVSCEKVINISLGGEGGVLSGYVDLSQILCKMNRKGAFRQGMQYVVESIRVNSYGAPSSEVKVTRLPDNYVTTNSFVKALSEWNEQQLDEAKEAGTESMIAKWRDFKVFMTAGHANDGGTGNLLPDGYELTDVSPGAVEYEWGYSDIVVPNVGSPGTTVEYKLHMLGDDNGSTSKSVIKAYAESRSREMAPDPNIVTNTYGGLWTDIEDVGEISDEIIENVSTRNNSPPYPLSTDTQYENYPGGVYVGTNIIGHVEAIAPISEGMRSVIPGFVAPLGLLHIGTTNDVGITRVQIRLAAGNHHGVLAQSMKEAN